MIAETVHKLMVSGVLVLPMLYLTGLVLRHAAMRLCVATVLAALTAVLPWPSDSGAFAAVAGALWPLSAGLAVGLVYEFATVLRGRPPVPDRDYALFTALVLVIGLALYPAALGAHLPDLYALGYSGWTVPAVMASLLAAGALAGSWLTVAWVGVAAAFALSGAAPGLNLWDSLIDPVIFVGAIAGLLRAWLARRRLRSPA